MIASSFVASLDFSIFKFFFFFNVFNSTRIGVVYLVGLLVQRTLFM